ncbi:ChaN family lipoprotein [Nitrosomonas sp. Is37]|uniref:ChaN family lipoprotein n=1 Tax=Nitrosomonas sp. Is37 TaxID=3080535 RepID=UPI00294B4C79|nr:ChaN family lipoprotein [Nitrosomonas sp. Is37]MDV6343717.1 ChaN family lipoprotein [Nitrosomonas sp. Is37]
MTKWKVSIRSGLVSIMLLAWVGHSENLPAQIIPAPKPESAISDSARECVSVAHWIIPGKGKTVLSDIIARAANQSVVLLGETHVNREHHLWQLQMLAALYAARPDMVIGFEMFPRRVQKVLDQWVAGELSEAAFLKASEWDTVWRTDASLYLPLFHFARMNRIPMRALNIDTQLRKQVAEKGFDSVPKNEREGVTHPAPPNSGYLDFLLPIYEAHDRKGKKEGRNNRYDPDFLRFVIGQQLWDRAMAQEIHAVFSTQTQGKSPLVVGIMGSGHIMYGYGVPHQLKDLGVTKVTSLLPWDTNKSCQQLVAGYADAVFGVSPFVAETTPLRQRLGIRYETALQDGGARVLQVEKGSIAEAANMLEGDLITEIAGLSVMEVGDIVAVVKRQAPGTWLPLKIKRGNDEIEIVAKFPALGK